MANLDRINAGLDAIETAIETITEKISNLGSSRDDALAEAADKVDSIKASLDELDALVDRAGETPAGEPPTEPTEGAAPA